jgi:predicted O-methyltransferase YrrM
MSADRWAEVERYFSEQLLPSDPVLDAVLLASHAAGLPPHHVTPNQGKLLQLFAKIQGSRRILEIGTLGGYSTIWLARSLLADGLLVTLEINPAHAAVARANLQLARGDAAIDLRVGPASASLAQLVVEGGDPFDLIFIDADKPSNPEYLRWALKLSRVGTLIIADNVVRNGAVIETNSSDPNVIGVRRFTELLGAEPRVSATAVQTVGSKGYDGFVIALVIA